MANDHVLSLRLLAAAIVRGSTVRAECVNCGEPTMTVTHKDDGNIAYHCKRASCGASGYVGGNMYATSPANISPPRDWQYRGALFMLDDVDLDYFAVRFGLSHRASIDAAIRRTECDEYAFLIRTPAGALRGHVVRQPTWGLSTYNLTPALAPRRGRPGQPKTREFLEAGKPGLAWYQPGPDPLVARRAVVVVEDCVSAMCAAARGYTAVALSGTFATWKEADEIRNVAGTRNVLVAFDNDATGTAYGFSQKWGLSFEKCRVVRLPRDLKDEDPNRITSVLGD
jgi:ribosomal protein S27AE